MRRESTLFKFTRAGTVAACLWTARATGQTTIAPPASVPTATVPVNAVPANIMPVNTAPVLATVEQPAGGLLPTARLAPTTAALTVAGTPRRAAQVVPLSTAATAPTSVLPSATRLPSASALASSEEASGALAAPASYNLASNSVANNLAPAAAPKPEPPKYPNVTVNGVFQADAGFFSQDDSSLARFGRIQDGADFRRARLSAKGALTSSVNYFFQMDFAFFGRPTFTDVWLEQTGLPVLGNFRIGQWKQPFSLEVVSSFRYTTFMERSLLFQPFTPFRHIGAGFYDHSDNLRWTWAASGFRAGQDQFGDSISTDGGWGTAERITHVPYYDDASDGRYYLHLGLGHFYSNPPNDTVNFRSIPELFIGENAPGVVGTSGQAVPGALNGTPFVAATGPVSVNHYNVLGSEALWVWGPLSWQTEAMVNFVDQSNGAQSTLWGFYSQVGWFLTGEHRPYDRVAGAIDRVKPFEDFFRVRTGNGIHGGRGAWEIASRVSQIHLNSNGIRGGIVTDYTAGLNWYWNAYTKLVFNYVMSMPDSPTLGLSQTHIFGMRAQMDF